MPHHRRMSMTLQAAAPPATAAPGDAGFHALVVPEGIWSGDGRRIEPGALSLRNLPLPLMGLIETTPGHDQAVAVGHFDRFELVDGMWNGWGQWATSPEAARIRSAVRAGDVTGVSVDLDDVASEILIDADAFADPTAEGDEPPTEIVDGDEVVVLDMAPDRERVTAGRIMGATIVPFPAFQECSIVDLRPDDPLGADEVDADALVAAVTPPVAPPARWFDEPDPARGVYSVTIDDDGHIHGYPAASWSDCHLSFADQCVTPPRSATDYAYFRTGEVACDDGSRVRVGQLCLRGGHADRSLTAQAAMAHYDDTDSAFADVAIGENRLGMWIAGALRPNITPEAVRVAMASGLSGDWRPVAGNLELIAMSCVNTPGYRPASRLFQHDGLVASMIVDLPQTADAYIVSAIERVAASIGRSTDQRLAALDQRVHG